MNKSIALTVVSAVAIVALIFLALSLNTDKAEEKAMNAVAINSVAEIKKFESKSSEWGKYYPRQYDSYMQTKKSDKIDDLLKKDPALIIMWAG
ncbi:MAG: ammonia-forming cytochrome c nitrite reductase subunit c552, partial [Desulfobacterales bacterium]|nr:ammonia-forming cytochrome c nitrite reductase subunit c552 [Desulfobacterales bacterium]